jgi:cardiolipin synthase
MLALCLFTLAAGQPARQPARASGGIVSVYIEPRDGIAPIVQFIQTARQSLDGEVYLASSKPVLAALEVAAGRGVTVRIALEQHPYGTGSAAPALVYRSLSAHGVQVRWTSRAFTYTHAKYLVEDNTVAWIGTPNWTTSAFRSNREFAVVDTDSANVREAESVFQADWATRPR